MSWFQKDQTYGKHLSYCLCGSSAPRGCWFLSEEDNELEEEEFDDDYDEGWEEDFDDEDG